MVRGLLPGVAVHFAGCCHPIPGDPIVGVVRTGRGVTIHRSECATLTRAGGDPERWLDLAWNPAADSKAIARLQVMTLNQPGSLGSLSTAIGRQGGNITDLRFGAKSPDLYEMILDIEVDDLDHLGRVVAGLRATAGRHPRRTVAGVSAPPAELRRRGGAAVSRVRRAAGGPLPAVVRHAQPLLPAVRARSHGAGARDAAVRRPDRPAAPRAAGPGDRCGGGAGAGRHRARLRAGAQLGVLSLFVERRMAGSRCGAALRSSRSRVLLAEDVVTTGLSSRECMACVTAAGTVVAAACLIDRSGGRADLGVPLIALAELELPVYPPDRLPPDLPRAGDQAGQPAGHGPT